MEQNDNQFFDLEQVEPGLRKLFEDPPVNPNLMIRIGVPADEPGNSENAPSGQPPRSLIVLASGENIWSWEVPSLRALFRGDRQPPVLGDYPEAYPKAFALLDIHLLEFARLKEVPRDDELHEIFSCLRRRPDGRSLGPLHDHLWRAAALVLGLQPLSQAEFEAIMARLERSSRTFRESVSSRNMVEALWETYEPSFRAAEQ